MKKVIFDVDGVLLSEKRYFDVSALVLWEWYYSEKYLHLGHETVTAELSDEAIDRLRGRFWKDDAILLWLKKHGVNSNWDMSTPISSSPCGSCWNGIPHSMVPWKPSLRRMPTFKGSADFFSL